MIHFSIAAARDAFPQAALQCRRAIENNLPAGPAGMPERDWMP